MILNVTPFEFDMVNLALQATAGNMQMLAQNLQQQKHAAVTAEQEAAAQREKAMRKAAAAEQPKRGRPPKAQANGAGEQPTPPA